LFALASSEFGGTNGHAGAVVFDIKSGDGIVAIQGRKGCSGFFEIRGEAVDETVEGALFELQSGEGVEGFAGFMIGGAVGGGPSDEFGHCGSVVPDEVEGLVQRGSSAVTLGMMEVTALEDNRAEEGLHGDGTLAMNDFARERRSVVGYELPVVEKFLDDAPGVTGEGGAQPFLEVLA